MNTRETSSGAGLSVSPATFAHRKGAGHRWTTAVRLSFDQCFQEVCSAIAHVLSRAVTFLWKILTWV